MAIEIQLVSWEAESEVLKQIRYKVFVEEQSVPVEEEWDGEDPTATHLLAVVNEQPVGTARLLPSGQITRMAVLKPFRGIGLGASLLKKGIEELRKQGIRTPFLHAQTHALSFYEQHGFVAEGEEFLDAGIPHFAMTLRKTS